jgi:hypothetical protein
VLLYYKLKDGAETCESACRVRDSAVEFVTVLVLSVRVYGFYERASTGGEWHEFGLVEALSLLLEN